MLSKIIVMVALAALVADAAKMPPVVFTEAEVKGENYIRPTGRSANLIGTVERRYLKSESSRDLWTEEAATNCPEQQVHLTLGHAKGSVIISFVNTDEEATSTVCYSTVKSDVESGHGEHHKTATGIISTYSQVLYYSSGNLIHPQVGKAYTTAADIAALQDTSSFAFDIVDGVKQEWSNYRTVDPNAPLANKFLYSTPTLYYDSPYLSTVTITGLEEGKTYYYRPHRSCKVYSFKIPANKYPIKIGLTADLGMCLIIM